jgi:hypothetical protein
MIEMEDAGALPPHFDHVEIALWIKGIAGVVAGDHHIDARRLQFMEGGHPAPSRRAAVAAVLQIEIAHRQRDDIKTGARDEINGAFGFVLALTAQRTAMADQHAPGKAMVERGLRNQPQRDRRRIGGLVDMKIEVETLARGETEKFV